MQTEFSGADATYFISVLPIMLISHFRIIRSFGKSKAGLLSLSIRKTIQPALLEIHYPLPWAIRHMGTIHGVYSDFGLLVSIILSAFGNLVSALLLLAMAILEKTKASRDLLAHTQVQLEAQYDPT